MKKIMFLIFLIISYAQSYGEGIITSQNLSPEKIFMENIGPNSGSMIDESRYMFLYDSFQLSGKIEYRVFKMAVKGYYKIQNKKISILLLQIIQNRQTKKDLLYLI